VCVCVCVCERACACVCVLARVRMYVCERACVCMCARARACVFVCNGTYSWFCVFLWGGKDVLHRLGGCARKLLESNVACNNYSSVSACTSKHIRNHTRAHTHTHTHVHTHTQPYKRTHTHIHVHTHDRSSYYVTTRLLYIIYFSIAFGGRQMTIRIKSHI
jgi:hypothetical protein